MDILGRFEKLAQESRPLKLVDGGKGKGYNKDPSAAIEARRGRFAGGSWIEEVFSHSAHVR